MKTETVILKAGDKVLSDSRYRGFAIETVARVTATTAILEDGTKLNNNPFRYGRAKGDSGGFGGTYYSVLTEDDIVKVDRQNMVRRLSKVDWAKTETDKLKKVIEILSYKQDDL